MTVPVASPKGNYGAISLAPVSLLRDATPEKPPVSSEYPLTFEALGQSYGFVLYETTVEIPVSDASLLKIQRLGDRAIVMVDGVSNENFHNSS